MDAADRGMELCQVPLNKLPPIALEVRNQLARRVGLCIEVCLTAFAWYAQVFEGLKTVDPLYRIDENQPEAKWLREAFSRVPACQLPKQPGDEKPVAEGSNITWGQLFGRK